MYIAFEGIDGSGKTTQVALARQYLEERGIAAGLVHFTGKSGGFMGAVMSTMYGRHGGVRIAARVAEWEYVRLVMYALNGRRNMRAVTYSRDGKSLLIGDRSVVTAWVVHLPQFSRLPLLWALESRAIPEAVIVLDLDVNEACQRIRARGEDVGKEKRDNLGELRERYLDLAYGKIPRGPLGGVEWGVVDASRPVGEVHRALMEWISRAVLVRGLSV